MSQLGSLSGKIQREIELLRTLNDSLLILQVHALGRDSELDISLEDVTRSYQFIIDFATRLSSALKEQTRVLDFEPLIHHFESGMKPIEDWIEDLETLIRQLKTDELDYETVVILEEILSLLDEQFTEDFRMLYFR